MFHLSKNFRSSFRTLCTTCQQKGTTLPHMPVMAEEVLSYMKVNNGQTLLDMTFGAGGHSRRLLQAVPNLNILALDRDPTAHGYAQKLSEEYPNQDGDWMPFGKEDQIVREKASNILFKAPDEYFTTLEYKVNILTYYEMVKHLINT